MANKLVDSKENLRKIVDHIQSTNEFLYSGNSNQDFRGHFVNDFLAFSIKVIALDLFLSEIVFLYQTPFYPIP